LDNYDKSVLRCYAGNAPASSIFFRRAGESGIRAQTGPNEIEAIY
jgi:hypothetical protein